MKTIISKICCLAFAAGFFAVGCGGSTAGGDEFNPLGEGNIPIGYVPIKDFTECFFLLETSDGQKSEGSTKGHTVYAKPLPYGQTKLTLIPMLRSFAPVTVTFEAGREQRYQANIRPNEMLTTLVVKDIESDIHDGQVLKIGQTYPINVHVYGSGAPNIAPSIVLSQGFGRLTADDEVVPTKPGKGQIILKVMDFVKIIEIRVE
ncbi:MAG: hypothetical protein JSS66_08980 [Armatimonadetes bacterium]|nr:hypothetical protein [Armatimonadota bacterium]